MKIQTKMSMNIDINKNIKSLIEKLGITPYEFSKQIGNKQASNIYNVINEKVKVGPATINKIVNRYPEYKDFILSGDKSDIIDDSNIDVISAPLSPISAHGGTLSNFMVSVKNSDCEKIISPIKGADWEITVSGDSMAPEYPSGSQILVKKINERAFIDWGKVYVLDTCNGMIIKILTPSKKYGYVKCVSLNPAPKYAPFDVAFNDIYGIYRVILCISLK